MLPKCIIEDSVDRIRRHGKEGDKQGKDSYQAMEPEKLSRLRIGQDQPGAIESRRIKRILFALISLAILSTAGYLVSQTGIFDSSVPVQITAVTLVYPSQTIADFNASGYVVAQRRASVASKGTGRLERLAVQEGSRVKQGEVLAELENNDVRAEYAQVAGQLAAARADLVRADTERRTAGRNFKRYQNLREQKVIPLAEYEKAEDQYTKAGAAVDSAKATIVALEAALNRASVLIEYTSIRAPFDGVILTKNADVGEVVAPFGSSINAKAAVVTMADLSSLMVQADVSESFLPRVHGDQACEIQLDALPDIRFPGRVHTIVPTADRAKGTVMVKVAFDHLDPRILPEMSARVAFLSRPLTAQELLPFLGVHRDAITERNGARGLFQVVDEQALWVATPTVEFEGDYVVLAGWLKGGEKVVLKPPPSLRSGDRVKIAE
jgi:HlyD family secretion protein